MLILICSTFRNSKGSICFQKFQGKVEQKVNLTTYIIYEYDVVIRCFMDCLVLLHYSELLPNVLWKRDYESNLQQEDR